MLQGRKFAKDHIVKVVVISFYQQMFGGGGSEDLIQREDTSLYVCVLYKYENLWYIPVLFCRHSEADLECVASFFAIWNIKMKVKNIN